MLQRGRWGHVLHLQGGLKTFNIDSGTVWPAVRDGWPRPIGFSLDKTIQPLDRPLNPNLSWPLLGGMLSKIIRKTSRSKDQICKEQYIIIILISICVIENIKGFIWFLNLFQKRSKINKYNITHYLQIQNKFKKNDILKYKQNGKIKKIL